MKDKLSRGVIVVLGLAPTTPEESSSSKRSIPWRLIALVAALGLPTAAMASAVAYGVLQNDYQPLLSLLNATTDFLVSAAEYLKQKTT